MKRIQWKNAGRMIGALLLALTLLGGGFVPAMAAPDPPTAAATAAVNWIIGQQQEDGSFPGFGAGSTADVVLALAARVHDPNGIRSKGGNSPLDFLMSKAADLAKTPGGAAKVLLAAVIAGKDPANFGGVDLVGAINKGRDAATGHYGQDVTGQALVILALQSRRDLTPMLDARAYDWLVGVQGPEGGWSYSGDTKPGSADTNTTGLVLQALATAPPGTYIGAINKALAYLHTQQNADGGFPYAQGDPTTSASDANSTAAVVSGLDAVQNQTNAGSSTGAWLKGSRTPLDALLAFANPSGAVRYQYDAPDDNAGATYQAAVALARWRVPVGMVPGQVYGQPSGNPAPTPGMPTTGAPGPAPFVPLAVALALLAVGAGLRRQAVRR